MKYLRWLFRLITWDGLLPLGVAYTPLAIKLLFPNQRGAVEIAAVVLPVAAFLFRSVIGVQQISASRRDGVLRKIQFMSFGIAILLLALIECVLILSHIMPAGALFAARGDRMVFAALLTIYFSAMAIAFFPGPNDN